MKIITWNCNMAFRKKADNILVEKPDILIIPECEHPDKLTFNQDSIKPNDTFWYGENQNKGLGIFTYSNFKIKLLSIHNPEFKYVLPLSVSNGVIEFTIFAIWAQKPKSHNCYTEQIWNAVHFYSDLLDKDNIILAGDFNSNTTWDKPNRIFNHANLVTFLMKKSIYSTYHSFNNQEHGKETSPTLFMQRKESKPYHIDFCFASQELISKIKSIEIGEFKDWTNYSDHKPLIVTFDI